jgi:hypothetical protein
MAVTPETKSAHETQTPTGENLPATALPETLQPVPAAEPGIKPGSGHIEAAAFTETPTSIESGVTPFAPAAETTGPVMPPPEIPTVTPPPTEIIPPVSPEPQHSKLYLLVAAISNFGHRASEAVHHFQHNAWETVKKIPGEVKKLPSESKEWPGKAKAWANGAVETAKKFSGEAKQKVLEYWPKSKEWAAGAVETVKNLPQERKNIPAKFKELQGKANEWFQNTKENFKAGMKEETTLLKHDAVELVHRATMDIFEISEKYDFDTVEKKPFKAAMDEFILKTVYRPWKVFRNLHDMDTQLRGRDLGSLTKRIIRIGSYGTLSAVASGVDSIDFLLKPTLDTLGPLGAGLGELSEWGTDWLIRKGTNKLIQIGSGDPTAQYSTPIAEAINFPINFVPIWQDLVNGPVVESAFRILYNIPVAGVPVEKLYRFLNDKITDLSAAIDDNPKLTWFKDGILVFTKGAAKRLFA